MSQNPPKPSLNALIQQLIRLPEDKRLAALKIIEDRHPAEAKQLAQYFKANKGVVEEARGGEHWLKKLGVLTFTRPFSPIQKRFIEWNWNAIQKVRDGIPLEARETVGFLPWPRETGKSSLVEWSCIMEGCLLKSGYVIYLSAKLSQAIDHVVAIRDRIESEHVADLYPWMGKPKLGTHGNKFGWGQEFLMTGGGWAIRPVGADVAMRGGKSINIRPTLIVPDDYDELGDSPHVVEHKEHMLTRAILPMGNANTRVLVPQNPIHPNSVVNRMLTGASLALAIKTVFGEINEDGSLSSRPIPAVNGLVYEVRQADEGPYSVITQGESNWNGISIEDWNTTLNRVGPEAFAAEYQHDMTVAQEERVLPEYDDRLLRLHVVTWSQVEAKYKMRRIPSDWPCDVGLDIGYTGSHKSAWTFLSKVPDGYELAGSIFRYRGRTFTGIGIDEQAVIIRSELWPDEHVQRQFMSHEKLGERLVLAQKHGWNFYPCDSAKIAGIAQWRHYLRPDRSQPHPFHRDEKDMNGFWKLGRPAWFDIVDDDQFISPRDDKGLKRHRDGAFNWRQVPVKLTDKGFTIEQPAKMEDDECLVAGTMITTQQGEIAIEHMKPDDVVLTRQGWYPVERAGLTSKSAEIWTIKLSNGSQLSGTKGHPIWVAGYGWKPLSVLRVGEKLLSSMECDSIVTQTQSIGRTERILSRMFTQLSEGSRRYISNSGRRLTGDLRKVIQFTTETTIPLTTPSQTLSHLPDLNTVAIMGRIGRRNAWLDSGKLWQTCKSWLKSGMGAKQGENGTRRTTQRAWLRFTKSAWSATVTTATKNIWSDLFGGDSAPALVSKNSTITVISVNKEVDSRPVYNLTVKDCPEYLANGVLVHNCDSTRMLTVGFGPLQKTLTPQQKLEAMIPKEYRPQQMMERNAHPNQIAMTNALAMMLAKQAAGGGNKVVVYDEYGNQRS